MSGGILDVPLCYWTDELTGLSNTRGFDHVSAMSYHD